jgi:hypothetical protein
MFGGLTFDEKTQTWSIPEAPRPVVHYDIPAEILEQMRTPRPCYYEEEATDEEKAIAELNSQYAVVIVKSSIAILKERTKDGIDFLPLPAFHTWFSNKLVKVIRTDTKGELVETFVPKSKVWLSSAERREYEGVDFSPAGNVSRGHYNLWTGWGVEPKTGGSCDKFLAHVFENARCGNKDHYYYVLAWFADIIQDPERIKGVAMVLRGLKGTGKSKVAEVMRHIIGRHSITVAHSRQLTGNFNAHLVGKLLIVAEESFWSGDKTNEGPLKNMITASKMTIELKGKDCFEIPSLSRVLMITNNEWAVPASSDERRYAVFDVGTDKMQDAAYFAAIDAEMKNGGYEALFSLKLCA